MKPVPAVNPLAAARFVRSAHGWEDLPEDRGIEIAFAGRSNAGKSSALNALTGRTRLAFVSKTPGRTQLINFFSVCEDRHLVDLPGYGYAGVPLTLKEHWGQLLSRYVATRGALSALVVTMDARRPLTPLDRQLLEWFAPSGKRARVLLTKSDKLSRSQAKEALTATARFLHDSRLDCTAQLFSSTSKEGVEEAVQWIAGELQIEMRPQKTKTPG